MEIRWTLRKRLAIALWAASAQLCALQEMARPNRNGNTDYVRPSLRVPGEELLLGAEPEGRYDAVVFGP